MYLGTDSLRDVLLDMRGKETTFLTGKAHTGIVKGVGKVWSKVGKVVAQASHQFPQYKLVLTGNKVLSY